MSRLVTWRAAFRVSWWRRGTIRGCFLLAAGAAIVIVVVSPSRRGISEDYGVGSPPPVEYKSVSDYMGGWHAGKFDFDTRICGVTALNYESRLCMEK
eukprot:scaffold1640_cov161-Amphora_coffeaeformis.AAC.6